MWLLAEEIQSLSEIQEWNERRKRGGFTARRLKIIA
jgi:hypothetical protein